MATPVLMRRAFLLGLILALFYVSVTRSEPLLAPGDMRLRHDLLLLNDAGVINVPLTAWPLASAEILVALPSADAATLSSPVEHALHRVRAHLTRALQTYSPEFQVGLAAAEPRVIRSFENTPRDDGELFAQISWLGDRFAVNLAASYVPNPFDGEEFRPDGTYLGAVFGNWIITAGWQERWLGPGNGGSLVLSTNARPTPGIGLQRNRSTPFASRWLRWIGPWTLTTFMTELDDQRTIDKAWLFGIRGSFRPIGGLEIGITRTAIWCGDGRPCDLSTFGDLLIGNDNRGVNVTPEDEPGNQLGGLDVRWALPRAIPVAAYMQWIGEDGRGGGGAVGSWLRQLGIEHWGSFGGVSHRSYFEVTDSMCKEGGFGFSDDKPDCAYEHGTYSTGYRYRGRSLGFPTDGDSRAYSLGSTLVQSGGHTWNATLRYMEINRAGAPNTRHTLTPTPVEQLDLQLSHRRIVRIGTLNLGLGYRHVDGVSSELLQSEVTGFLQWTSQ